MGGLYSSGIGKLPSFLLTKSCGSRMKLTQCSRRLGYSARCGDWSDGSRCAMHSKGVLQLIGRLRASGAGGW